MKTSQLSIQVTIAVSVLLAFFIGSCFNSSQNKNEYPFEYKQRFMESCMIDPSRKDVCQCTLDALQKIYTYEEAKAIYEEHDKTKVDPAKQEKFQKALNKCIEDHYLMP